MRASTCFAFAALTLVGFVAAAPTPVPVASEIAVAQAEDISETFSAVENLEDDDVEYHDDVQEEETALEARGLTKAQKKKAAEKAAAKKAAAKKAAAKKAADKKKKKQKPSSNVQLNAGGQFSGQGTFYFQNGNYGSCGQKNPDSAVIVAVNTPQVAGGSHCGKSVRITNTSNGKTITARVADECPTCSYGSLDLSTGAYDQLGARSTGVLPIKWSWA